MSALLPKGWEWAKLTDVAKWGSGGTPLSTRAEYYNGNIPWLIIGDLNDGIVSSSQNTISEIGLQNSSAKYVEKGSVLIAMYGSIGKLGIAGKRLTTNQAIAFTSELYDNIHNWYLFYYLLSQRQKLHGLGKGGTQKNISQTVLKEVEIPLPPLNEQRRIVAKLEALLSELEAAVAQLQAVQAQLSTYRQAVLKAAFEGRLTAAWRAQQPALPTADALLEQIAAARAEQAQATGKKRKPTTPLSPAELAALPELPPGWAWVRVEEISEVVTGYTPKVRTGNISTIPFFKPTDLDIGYGISKAREYLPPGDYERLVPSGSVLITCIGATIGKSAYTMLDCVTNQQINSLTYIFGESKFWYYQVIGPRFQSEIIKNASSTTLPIINKGRTEQLIATACSIDEQHQIVHEIESRLSLADQLAEAVSAGLRQAEALRQSLLQQAFSGRLVPQDPTDEPASALLARLRAAAPTPRPTRHILKA